MIYIERDGSHFDILRSSDANKIKIPWTIAVPPVRIIMDLIGHKYDMQVLNSEQFLFCVKLEVLHNKD